MHRWGRGLASCAAGAPPCSHTRRRPPADGLRDARPLALDDVKLDAQRGQRREDVAEHDHAVRLEGAPGLQRELNGNLRSLGPLPEGDVVGIPARGASGQNEPAAAGVPEPAASAGEAPGGCRWPPAGCTAQHPRSLAHTPRQRHLLAELRHVPPRLPHQPHRGPLRDCSNAAAAAGE